MQNKKTSCIAISAEENSLKYPHVWIKFGVLHAGVINTKPCQDQPIPHQQLIWAKAEREFRVTMGSLEIRERLSECYWISCSVTELEWGRLLRTTQKENLGLLGMENIGTFPLKWSSWQEVMGASCLARQRSQLCQERVSFCSASGWRHGGNSVGQKGTC